MKKFVSMLVIAAMTLLSAAAQEAGFLTLYGHAVDSSTGEALFFTSVSLPGTTISNVSNADGFFSFKLPADTPQDATITVSHLGYLTQNIPITAFANCDTENPLLIRMAPVAIQLDPATVRSIDPYYLFLTAFYKVRDNYPKTRVGMTAFYREMVKKGAAKYLVLNEAVLDIDKSPYTGFMPDRAGIYKGRGSINYDSSDTLFVKLQGGIKTAMDLDIVRYPFIGTTIDEAKDAYNFSISGITSYDGQSFYVLEFDQRSSTQDEVLARGRLYIETESYAIGRVEFSLNVEGHEEEAAKAFVVKRPQGTRFFVQSADYVVSYKCFDGLWYFDYFRGDVDFFTRKVHSPFRANFSVTEEMAITDHREGGIAIEPAGRVKFRDILTDRVSDFTDKDFWGSYNIIEPDQSIDVIIRRIIRQINRHSER